MAPSTLKRLINLQKTHLTEIKFMEGTLRSRQGETMTPSAIQSRIDSLAQIWSETRRTHAEIFDKDDAESSLYIIENVFAEMQVIYEDTRDLILTFQPSGTGDPANVSIAASGSGDVLESQQRPAKLPKLDLPTFSGRSKNWESFCDLFTSLVHNASRVSDATKLHYLKSCLNGSAAYFIKDVATTDANYISTWRALKSRFYNPRLTVNNHLNALLDLPHLKRESASELRSFTDEAQRIVRALSNLQMPVKHWDIWLVHLIGARLDPESRKLWETDLSTKDLQVIAEAQVDGVEANPLSRFPKFEDLINCLEKRTQALSMLAADYDSSRKRIATPRQLPGSRRVFHASASRPAPSSTRVKCVICSGLHFLSKCPTFLSQSVFDRKREVRRLRLCFNCLGPHQCQDCPSRGRCHICHVKHHSLLHFDVPTRSQPTRIVNSQQPPETSQAIQSGVSSHTASPNGHNKYSVILAIAQITLKSPIGAQTRVRALLDQGSEATFVTESIVQLLKLPKHQVNIPLTGIGARATGAARSITRFTLQSINNPSFEIQTDALVLPRLTSHLPARDLLEVDLSQYVGLSLADPKFHMCNSVDVILGSDVYASLLPSGIKHFPPSKLIAQSTALGWVISGPLKTQPHIPKLIDRETSVKVLGVYWDPNEDEFSFRPHGGKILVEAFTKRAVLSCIAQLFDPLGWIAPITITAKILMRDLWILRSDWDSPLPVEIRTRWLDYCHSLSSISTLKIHRCLAVSTGCSAQIHGFSVASKRAYAAAIYLLVDDGNGQIRVSLLAAKSKVAPIKSISVPNLELCGAVLLVKLIRYVQRLEFLKDLPVFAWSDSRIVLSWLDKHPCYWKTFVANRISFIQTELPSATWAYVPSKDNPADLASRGYSDLSKSEIWWHGPDWLSLSSEHWPRVPSPPQVLHVLPEALSEPEILSRFSSLSKLLRVVAHCLGPLSNLQRSKRGLEPLPSFLTTSELSNAQFVVIRLAQSHAFSSEIALVTNGTSLPKRSTLRKLNPVVDPRNGILRVGGRLVHSQLSHESKHPSILPRRSSLSRLFIRYAHLATLHGGPTLTSSRVMQNVWIIGQTRLVKTEIRNCATCQRVKPRLAYQLMGDLPVKRVTPARPFTASGLEYAGPFQIRTSKGRGRRSYKGYIALFVCFATRAIHLELVSDLTTAAFLAAYRRFVGRRGVCRHMYSDNAKTFRGADKELRAMFQSASAFYKSATSTLSNEGTDWTFIPPNAPHYGGLWEAGVKSVKHHLKRVIGDHSLTFEEMSTLLVEIEACLNSRPLCPLSADVDDLHALTPAHFLTGEISAIVPDERPPAVPMNRLSRFQLLERIRNQFWDRWSAEYLQHLQERGKWRDPCDNFVIGQLVLIKDKR